MDANVLPAFMDDARQRAQTPTNPALAFTDPLPELCRRQQIIQIEAL
jgi:hypothetical protein